MLLTLRKQKDLTQSEKQHLIVISKIRLKLLPRNLFEACQQLELYGVTVKIQGIELSIILNFLNVKNGKEDD